MRMFVALVAIVAALIGVVPASAGSSVPQFPRLPGNWSHAEINVTIHRVPHTLILDRGRIVQATPTQITVRHPDGTSVTIEIVRRTIINLDGFRVLPRALGRGESVETMQIDGPPAVRVRATNS
jgi:hypothetical protein